MMMVMIDDDDDHDDDDDDDNGDDDGDGDDAFASRGCTEIFTLELLGNQHLPKQIQARSLDTLSGGSHSKNNGLATYSANVIAIIERDAGRVIITVVQLNRNPGRAPNASNRYAYSEPDFWMHVPSSI